MEKLTEVAGGSDLPGPATHKASGSVTFHREPGAAAGASHLCEGGKSHSPRQNPRALMLCLLPHG